MKDDLTSPVRGDGKRKRRSIRLAGYDYAQPGAYFVTVAAYDRKCLFGDIAENEMRLNEFGQVVLDCWSDLKRHYPYVDSDAFVVMPNHVHGIIVLMDDADEMPNSRGVGLVGAGLKPAPTGSEKLRHGLPEIVRAFKTFSARRVNAMRGTPGVALWQRGYYEHIVRNDAAHQRIRDYIADNPALWQIDRENPAAISLTEQDGG